MHELRASPPKAVQQMDLQGIGQAFETQLHVLRIGCHQTVAKGAPELQAKTPCRRAGRLGLTEGRDEGSVGHGGRQRLFLLRGHGPDASEGEFGFEVFVEFVVVGEEGFEEVFAGPEADIEEAMSQFPRRLYSVKRIFQ